MNKVMDINMVIAESGLSNVYVRRAIQQGKLLVTKGFVGETRVPKNYIKREDYEAWRAGIASSKREDGRNKYVIYMTEAELEQVKALLSGTEVVTTIARANQKAVAEDIAE